MLRLFSLIFIFQGHDLSYVGIDNYLVNQGTVKGNCKVVRMDSNITILNDN